MSDNLRKRIIEINGYSNSTILLQDSLYILYCLFTVTMGDLLIEYVY